MLAKPGHDGLKRLTARQLRNRLPVFDQDETAACLVISDDIFAMLLTEAKFREFTPKPVCDASKCTEVLVCLSCESREQVDDLVRRAVAAGGTTYIDPKDYGFMYQHGFQDPDGHIWELIYMEAEARETAA